MGYPEILVTQGAELVWTSWATAWRGLDLPTGVVQVAAVSWEDARSFLFEGTL